MKYLKIIGVIITTIFLGALGSGLWERLISPTLDNLSRKSIKFVDSINSGYLDSIYKSAAYDLPNIYQQKIVGLILVIVGIYWLYSLLNKYDWCRLLPESLDKEKRTKLINQITHISRIYFLIISLFLIGFGVFLLSKSDYIQKTISYSYRSLEILRPFIGEKKYIELKSDYYQVDSSNLFTAFNLKIKLLSKQHKVKLPEFEIIK